MSGLLPAPAKLDRRPLPVLFSDCLFASTIDTDIAFPPDLDVCGEYADAESLLPPLSQV